MFIASLFTIAKIWKQFKCPSTAEYIRMFDSLWFHEGFSRQEYWNPILIFLPGESHSNILAWRIPWTDKLGRLQSMESQRVKHDWATNGFNFFFFVCVYSDMWGFPHSSVGKESACDSGYLGSIPGLGRSPGERNGNPLQYSCLENPMSRGAWQATVHGVTRVGHDLATKPPQFIYVYILVS